MLYNHFLLDSRFQQQCHFYDIVLSDIQAEYFWFNILKDPADINLTLRQGHQNTLKGHTKKMRHDLSILETQIDFFRSFPSFTEGFCASILPILKINEMKLVSFSFYRLTQLVTIK